MTLNEIVMEEGDLKKAIKTARKMQEEGLEPDQIIRISGLFEDQLKENGFV